jgi:tRNA threonylcarbamoyladenosine biosynthesis protein TsaB
MLTLAFDTSSRTAAVAVLQDDTILYDSVNNTGLNHSEVLMPSIEYALRQLRIKISDIDLFACTIGPGSFTGLRIGVSTLKGLMLATGKPACGVSTLAAVALNLGTTSKLICSMIDAGRGQVYVAYFRYNDKNILQKISEEKAGNPKEIIDNTEKNTLFVGDGVIKYADIIKNIKSPEFSIASDLQHYVRASAVGILGSKKFAVNDLLDASTLVPVYLRSADAKPHKSIFEPQDNLK